MPTTQYNKPDSLEGVVTVGAVSALGGALASIGIPDDTVLEYETEIKAGKSLLITHDTAAEVAWAREILGVNALVTA